MICNVTTTDALALISQGTNSIDVRAPIEFKAGTIPLSRNLPLMNDAERALVGTCFKREGSDAATALGYDLVSDGLREQRIKAWVEFLYKEPDALLFCARGGKRSQISAEWIRAAGLDIQLIQGGFRAMRALLSSFLSPNPNDIVILGGSTGVGKTVLVRADQAAIDLEGYANHRGSAFGAHLDAQPSQVSFENKVALDFFRMRRNEIGRKFKTPMLMEDEGRTIGKIHLPLPLQSAMKNAPLVILEDSFDSRAQHIFKEYVLEHLKQIRQLQPTDALDVLDGRLSKSLQAISKRLGMVRYRKISYMLDSALTSHRKGDASGHLEWIKTLLKEYYDPMYQFQLDKKKHRVIFRGLAEEVVEWRSVKVANQLDG